MRSIARLRNQSTPGFAFSEKFGDGVTVFRTKTCRNAFGMKSIHRDRHPTFWNIHHVRLEFGHFVPLQPAAVARGPVCNVLDDLVHVRWKLGTHVSEYVAPYRLCVWNASTMAYTPDAVADLVLVDHGDLFTRDRTQVQAEVAQPRPRTGTRLSIRSASLVDPSITIRVASLLRDATKWGTLTQKMFLYTIVTRYTAESSDGQHAQSVRGFDFESEGWARAALSLPWSDYAYRIETYTGATRPVFFHVLIDREANAHLAPKDFDWVQSGPGGLVERHKLRPERQNATVTDHLRRYGDLLP